MDNGREDKNPWDRWFWQDYDSDPNLRACSLAAQGLWMRLLSYMARSRVKGYLLCGDSAMDNKTISKLVGEPEDLVAVLVIELGDRSVYSKTLEGVIFNRRMARESLLKHRRSLAGEKGMKTRWGDNKSVSPPITAPQNTCITPSVSVSDNIISINKEGDPRGSGADDAFELWWGKYPRKLGKQDARKEYLRIAKEADVADLDKALENYLREIREHATEMRYVKHPTTFLRSERWRDYLGLPLNTKGSQMPEWAIKALEKQRKENDK